MEKEGPLISPPKPKTSRPPYSMYCSFQTLLDPTQFKAWDILDKGCVDEVRWIVDTMDPTLIYRVMLHACKSRSQSYWKNVMLAFEGYNLHKKPFNRSSTPFLVFCDGPGKRIQFANNKLERPLTFTSTSTSTPTTTTTSISTQPPQHPQESEEARDPDVGDIIPALMTTWNSRAFLDTYPTSLDFLMSPFHSGIDLLKVGEVYLGSRIWNMHENLDLFENWKCLELHRGFLKGAFYPLVNPDQVKASYDMEGLVLDPLTLVIPLLVQHCSITGGKIPLDHHQRQAMAVYVKKRSDLVRGETSKLGLLAQYGNIYPADNPQAGVLSKSQQVNMQHKRKKEKLALSSFLQKHPSSEWVHACLLLTTKTGQWLWRDALGDGTGTACLPPTTSLGDSVYNLDDFVRAVKA